ncbi:MAG: chromosomal replication initiator protein DnaA, partial [Planctomycetota bacterium]
AAVAVADQPGTAYNPLFIHGGVGLGKTHLLQAICQKILNANPDYKILYVSCDAFMNQFFECVRSGQMSEFHQRYRHVDMLVIDDIHFLADKERSQEEFFHTFNELYQHNKQIVLSSDAAPNEIPKLEERLVSRFNWGLVAQVGKPCFETRIAILKAKAQLRSIEVPDEVIELIASRIDTNARELEGAITNLIAHAKLQNLPIGIELAREMLGAEMTAPRNNQVTLQVIIDAVTNFYNVKLQDLQSRRRHKSITEPRQICMWLARKNTRFSLEEIGGYFGGRDHTTVMHSIKTVDGRSETDATYAAQVQQLNEQIQQQV